MLGKGNAVLVVVDVQGNLAQMMHQRDILFRNLRILIKGMRLLDVPVIWVEQVPEKLGPTVEEVRGSLEKLKPIPKQSFSCAECPEFLSRLEGLNRKDVILSGIETHVCIYQTAADLIARGFEVHVVADAVSSRTESNKRIGLDRILSDGGHATSTEMLLFELQRNAGGAVFRKLIKLVK
jgi:nicotinamidase-related amidase